MFEFMDPFVMQLIIVPTIVIGLGVTLSIMTKKIYVGPVVTLILNLIYEASYSFIYYPDSGLSFTPWSLIFPAITLFFCWMAHIDRKLDT